MVLAHISTDSLDVTLNPDMPLSTTGEIPFSSSGKAFFPKRKDKLLGADDF
jgi:hypothetical protein